MPICLRKEQHGLLTWYPELHWHCPAPAGCLPGTCAPSSPGTSHAPPHPQSRQGLHGGFRRSLFSVSGSKVGLPITGGSEPRRAGWRAASVRSSRGSWRPGRVSGTHGRRGLWSCGVQAASLVQEVSLERGGQRQRRDGAQALLPQGQAHRPPAEVHERQGLGWGWQRGTELRSAALHRSRATGRAHARLPFTGTSPLPPRIGD